MAPKQPMPTLVALATYNEAENLPSLVEAIRAQLPDAEVLVVDDNSPDGTGRWCDQYAADRDWMHCIHRPGKMGLGSAAWTAMQWAVEREFDWLITLDADWSHSPEALPSMVEASAEADLVIGSRYCPGGGVQNWPMHRRVLSRVVNQATRWSLGAPVGDASGAYRMYRVELLRQIDWQALREPGYAYLEEILSRLLQLGARVAEVPITFRDRMAGQSKASAREAWGKLRGLRRIAWRRFRGARSGGASEAETAARS